HNKRHPSSMGNSEVEAFLDHILLKRNMSAKTQAANGVVSPFSKL
ncbi:phage integrase N-terminal SAM-like domain-containing protein, partial [Pseudoalteromonas marina]